MRTLQVERELVVIDLRGRPSIHGMADRAVMVVLSLLVIGILDTVEVRHMARITVCRRSVVPPVDVA